MPPAPSPTSARRWRSIHRSSSPPKVCSGSKPPPRRADRRHAAERPPSSYDRVVPLIVAVALFMENMDSTVISTSLPAIARALGTNPLALKLAVTSYLLALAICIPASGWTADRFGARHVFRIAIGVFVLGSIGCALSRSLEEFVLARIVQGMGGAMMTPVGRLIFVRSIDKRLLVNAMSLVTIPALIGPICGPPLGGFITTYASWHWIFIINVPIGLVGLAMATRYIPDVRAERPAPFDYIGFILSALGIGGLAFGLSVMGLEFLPVGVVAALLGVGAALGGGLHRSCATHARRRSSISVCSSFRRSAPVFSAASCSGSVSARCPFCCRCLLQIGFDLTPFQSGLITFTGALGSMFMKAAVAARAQALRLSPRARLQQPHQRRVSRRLRQLRSRHAVCRDDRHSA